MFKEVDAIVAIGKIIYCEIPDVNNYCDKCPLLIARPATSWAHKEYYCKLRSEMSLLF